MKKGDGIVYSGSKKDYDPQALATEAKGGGGFFGRPRASWRG